MTPRRFALALAAGFACFAAERVEAQTQVSQACYVPASGTVYVIGLAGAPSNCADGHTEVTLQGPQGVPGNPGSPGAFGFEVVTMEIVGDAGSALAAVNVPCPAGKVPVGGGFSMYSAMVRPFLSHPINENGAWHWRVMLGWVPSEPSTETLPWGTGYAVCLAMN
jgi:hypothetical protein